jgi:hypothetical protein
MSLKIPFLQHLLGSWSHLAGEGIDYNKSIKLMEFIFYGSY